MHCFSLSGCKERKKERKKESSLHKKLNHVGKICLFLLKPYFWHAEIKTKPKTKSKHGKLKRRHGGDRWTTTTHQRWANGNQEELRRDWISMWSTQQGNVSDIATNSVQSTTSLSYIQDHKSTRRQRLFHGHRAHSTSQVSSLCLSLSLLLSLIFVA